eukprot:TRINITY_DN10629_c0_g1_i2.p1 TRINITY_DN10629_c0_g1~~TRINITY_DN10629_c0_g1_i2.p1  ORF type:complete len:165 (-),score=21.15 TRINITY_DN10629_c0_g1_i2:90-584(-)
MKRAIYEHDTWSGHVCFPGGKCEHNEPMLQTAIRETFEETAMNLNDTTKFVLLGRTENIVQPSYDHHPFTITVFLFLQIVPEVEIHLNLSELIDYQWVNPSFFVDAPVKTTEWHSNRLSITMNNMPGFVFPKGVLTDHTFYMWGLTLRLTFKILLMIYARYGKL